MLITILFYHLETNSFLVFIHLQVRAMLDELETVRGIKNETNNKMLEDAFALLAYPNPWDCPVG